MFYPYEGYRSVTPLDAARVNRTIFDNHSVHWYYITLIKGRYSIKHDINVRRGKQNPLVYIYCYYLRTGLFCRDMTVSAIRCVVSTKYSVFSSCFVLCTRNSVSSSLRACRPSWSPPCQCVRPGIALAVGMLTQEQWLVPSMLYETVLYRDTFVWMNRMRLSNSYHIPDTRARFWTTPSSEYDTHGAPSLTRRLYSYIISLGVTILRLVLPVTHLEPVWVRCRL